MWVALFVLCRTRIYNICKERNELFVKCFWVRNFCEDETYTDKAFRREWCNEKIVLSIRVLRVCKTARNVIIYLADCWKCVLLKNHTFVTLVRIDNWQVILRSVCIFKLDDKTRFLILNHYLSNGCAKLLRINDWNILVLSVADSFFKQSGQCSLRFFKC